MRTKIRTVKPELFIHETLFDLEWKTGLPIRLGWIGLFTVCDREGRFEWRPRQIKLAVLPWDQVDFGKVLDALVGIGLVVRYQVNGRSFGYIPTWKSHQRINVKESASVLPPPPEKQVNSPTEEGELTGSSPTVSPMEMELEMEVEGELEPEMEMEPEEGESENDLSAPADPPPRVPSPDLLDLWNSNCGKLSKATAMSKKRVRSWSLRWGDFPDRGHWEAAIRRLAASPFCNGANDRGWKADLDFLLQPDTHLKALEGKYDFHPKARRLTNAELNSQANQELWDKVVGSTSQ